MTTDVPTPVDLETAASGVSVVYLVALGVTGLLLARRRLDVLLLR